MTLKREDKEMSFLDHLEELRWHVIRSLFAIIIFTIAALIYTPWIFENVITAPARTDFITFKWLCQLGKLIGSEDGLCVKEVPFTLQSRHMTGQFTMHIMSSLIIGLIVAFPYIAWEVWRFIKPGLLNKEKRYSRGAVGATSLLFFIGVLFGYFIVSPVAIYFLSSYRISDMIVNEFDITSYVGTVIAIVFGSGVIFELPIIMYFLTKVGIVTPAFLRKYRRHAIVIIFVVAAIVTPPDPLSQTLISIPLYLLFELSIFISAFVERQKAKEEADELENEMI